VEATSYLLYEDVDEAREFLSKAFDFRSVGVHMKDPDRKKNHAAIRRGKGMIVSGHPASGHRNPRRLGQATQKLGRASA